MWSGSWWGRARARPDETRIEAFSLRGQVLVSEATDDRRWGLASASAALPVYVKGRVQPRAAGASAGAGGDAFT